MEATSSLGQSMSFASAALTTKRAAGAATEFTGLLSNRDVVDDDDADPGTDVEAPSPEVERRHTGGDDGVPPDALKSKPQVREMVRNQLDEEGKPHHNVSDDWIDHAFDRYDTNLSGDLVSRQAILTTIGFPGTLLKIACSRRMAKNGRF